MWEGLLGRQEVCKGLFVRQDGGRGYLCGRNEIGVIGEAVVRLMLVGHFNL